MKHFLSNHWPIRKGEASKISRNNNLVENKL